MKTSESGDFVKKAIVLLLAISLMFLVSCGKDDSQKYIDEQEKKIQKIENDNKTEDGIFVLKNSLSEDIYSIEFVAADKENLILDAVLPAGNEVKIKNSGEWELKIKCIDDDGEYYYKSFGKINFDLDSVTLKEENGKYIAELE